MTSMHTGNNRRVFVDTSSFVALQDENDPNHQKALGLARKVLEQKIQLYTSSEVVGETLTVVSRKLGKKQAEIFFQDFPESGVIEIFFDSELHQKTIKLFLQIAAKNISFIDCSNVIIMQSLNIKQIFALDQDFKKLGATLLS